MGERGTPSSPTSFTVAAPEDMPERPRFTVIGLANIAIQRWRLFVILPIIAFAVATTVAVLSQNHVPQHTATSRFWNKTGGGASSSGGGGGGGAQAPAGGGLAALLGQQTESGPDFLGALVSSTELLRDLASTTYRVRVTDPEPGIREGTLAQVHGQNLEPEQDLKVGASLARQSIQLQTDRGGLVSLRTTAYWPELAVQLNYRLLELLNEYDIRIRRQDISTERRFIESRMQAALEDLARAESVAARFLETNRQYQQSPQLVLEFERLNRRVGLYQGIYTTLAQQNEQAKIEEVRNTPVITLFDKPEYSVVESRAQARPLFEGLMGLLVGFVAAIVIVFGGEILGRLPQQDPVEYARFRRLSRQALAGLIPAGLRKRRRKAAPSLSTSRENGGTVTPLSGARGTAPQERQEPAGATRRDRAAAE